MTALEIAKQYRVSVAAIFGRGGNNHSRVAPAKDAYAHSLMVEGFTSRQIAIVMGTAEANISRRLDREAARRRKLEE